jgi:hypothetical protein
VPKGGPLGHKGAHLTTVSPQGEAGHRRAGWGNVQERGHSHRAARARFNATHCAVYIELELAVQASLGQVAGEHDDVVPVQPTPPLDDALLGGLLRLGAGAERSHPDRA